MKPDFTIGRIGPRLLFAGLIAALFPVPSAGQWSTTHEQFYLPGEFNWEFRKNYPAADRLFNAFDYGHAILYEKLWTRPGAQASLLETREYDFITRKLLVNPPGLPLEERAIEVSYAKMAPEAKMMFEWAHILHRQLYDVWADESLTVREKDDKVHELLRYYRTRKDLAFSSVPKNMDLMEGQPYSLAFRKKYPKFNGLIWAYHWLQIGLYEPLLAGRNESERQTGVLAAVARFRNMLEQPPTLMPRVMPMTPAVAPLFTARYPEAAIIFDNLHSMHDVISDILANPIVPRSQKRAAIVKAAARYRDDTSYVMTREEWRQMATAMGVQNMGGPVRGFLTSFPPATVERGAVMKHHMEHHGAPAAAKPEAAGGTDHTGHAAPAVAPKPASVPGPAATKRAVPARKAAPTKKAAPTRKAAPARKKASVKSQVKPPAATKAKAAAKPKAKPDPHAGMDHSKMDTTRKR